MVMFWETVNNSIKFFMLQTKRNSYFLQIYEAVEIFVRNLLSFRKNLFPSIVFFPYFCE